MTVTTDVVGVRRRSRGRLFTWPLAGGLVVVALLVALSLTVGVYDVWGAPDGGEMFLITRIRAPSG